jgi:hypothetical protein
VQRKTLEGFGEREQAGKGTGVVILRDGKKVPEKWEPIDYCFGIEP